MLADGKTYKMIKHCYQKIKSDVEITRDYVSKGGTKFDKVARIEQHVLTTFVESRNRHEAIHDHDIVVIALLKARDVGLDGFKACPSWLKNFKRRNRIVSRRVKKIVPASYLTDEEAIKKRAQDFLSATIRHFIQANVPRHMIVNGDHTGLNLEMPSHRTLNEKGAKDIIVAHQKLRSITHSLTVYPVISLSGDLFPTFLICFYEPARPAKFNQELAEFDRLVCISSPSGKMTADLQLHWFRSHFVPQSPKGIYFLLDAWTGYKRAITDPELSNHINFVTLPEKTTSLIQPLDRFFNRQFKLFIRTIHEQIRRLHPNFNLSSRKHIASILNETHFMFSAPIFKSFIKFSWKLSGFLGIYNIPQFETPPEYCFKTIDVYNFCNCGSPPFIRCAWCFQNLCFDHFLSTRHRCNT